MCRKPLVEIKGRIKVFATGKSALTDKTHPLQSATEAWFPSVLLQHLTILLSMQSPFLTAFQAAECTLLSTKRSEAVKELKIHSNKFRLSFPLGHIYILMEGNCNEPV